MPIFTGLIKKYLSFQFHSKTDKQIMRNRTLVLSLIMLFVLGACTKNDTPPIGFGFKELSSFLNKTPEKIQNSSPGYFNAEHSTIDRLYFDYANHPTLGNVEVFYKINDGLCDLVCIYPENKSLETAYKLIDLSDKELKSALFYYVINRTKTGRNGHYTDSFNELKEYIIEQEITLENIEYIEARYRYKGKMLYVGAMRSEGVFLPFSDMEIEKKDRTLETKQTQCWFN
ncbi:MAG: hypothetical protein JW783_05770 [Bacteroidales bacterium]|nr:hypothetical protein [Bacteroidales bacterium]MBN2749365.1 hypothetical protein [Bacteroidales bacterium]